MLSSSGSPPDVRTVTAMAPGCGAVGSFAHPSANTIKEVAAIDLYLMNAVATNRDEARGVRHRIWISTLSPTSVTDQRWLRVRQMRAGFSRSLRTDSMFAA